MFGIGVTASNHLLFVLLHVVERRSLWRATIMERDWERADAAARAALNG